MPSPAKKGRQACNKYAHNNKEWVRISRAKNGDCTWCPPNGGENAKKHSNWGKKRAMKHQHATGKGRKQWFSYWYNKKECLGYAPQFYDKGDRENLYTS